MKNKMKKNQHLNCKDTWSEYMCSSATLIPQIVSNICCVPLAFSPIRTIASSLRLVFFFLLLSFIVNDVHLWHKYRNQFAMPTKLWKSPVGQVKILRVFSFIDAVIAASHTHRHILICVCNQKTSCTLQRTNSFIHSFMHCIFNNRVLQNQSIISMRGAS